MFINYFVALKQKLMYIILGAVYEFIPISMAVCYQTRFLLH